MYWSDIEHIAPRKIPVRRAGNGAMRRQQHPAAQPSEPYVSEKTVHNEVPEPQPEESKWQEMALRLQAEMDNFRKRQERRSDEAVTAERERILTLFLPVIDNLARALRHDDQADATVRQGVELTHRELMRLLATEGVTRLETKGQAFDPNWHEAVAVVPTDVEADTIVEEVAAGYKLDDRLLRPAKVVVAA